MAMEIENQDELMIVANGQEELIADVLEKLKRLDLLQLSKCQVALASAMSKPIKQAAKLLEAAANKKKRSSPHLAEFREWKEFVHAHAKSNGWPAFSVTSESKDSAKAGKVTNYEASVEWTEATPLTKPDASIKYVFPTASEKGKYKTMSPVQASSLAKYYWSAKQASGTRQDLWIAFKREYDLKVESGVVEDEKSDAAAEKKPKAKKAKMSEEEKEEAKAKKDAEKKQKAIESAAKKAADKLAKLKADADALEAKIASPDGIAALAAPKPRKAKKAAEAAESPKVEEVVAAVSPKVIARPKKAAIAAKDSWVPHPEGDLLEFVLKGKTYFRGNTSLYDEDGDFAGKFDFATQSINDDAENDE
jgi:hypothetical protein